MITQNFEIVCQHGSAESTVAVIIPLYNYAHHIEEALNSVATQTYRDLSLIVVDDSSTDNSLVVVKRWMEKQGGRMSSVLLKNEANSKLSITRNTGIKFANSKYCFMLDADNTIYARCIEKHVSALEANPCACAAYSLLEVFEGAVDISSHGVFCKDQFLHGNFVDAMALFRKTSLIEMNGYENIQFGWEDYDLWLRMIENGRFAIHIPEILSRYRQHKASMLRTETNKNVRMLHQDMQRRHPWLELR